MATVERSVLKIDRPEVQQGMTAQHRVRPLMPAAMRGDFAATDPFLALMEDWFPRGVFGKHPHRGIETVTYVVEGRIDHYDNQGHEGTLRSDLRVSEDLGCSAVVRLPLVSVPSRSDPVKHHAQIVCGHLCYCRNRESDGLRDRCDRFEVSQTPGRVAITKASVERLVARGRCESFAFVWAIEIERRRRRKYRGRAPDQSERRVPR